MTLCSDSMCTDLLQWIDENSFCFGRKLKKKNTIEASILCVVLESKQQVAAWLRIWTCLKNRFLKVKRSLFQFTLSAYWSGNNNEPSQIKRIHVHTFNLIQTQIKDEKIDQYWSHLHITKIMIDLIMNKAQLNRVFFTISMVKFELESKCEWKSFVKKKRVL